MFNLLNTFLQRCIGSNCIWTWQNVARFRQWVIWFSFENKTRIGRVSHNLQNFAKFLDWLCATYKIFSKRNRNGPVEKTLLEYIQVSILIKIVTAAEMLYPTLHLVLQQRKRFSVPTASRSCFLTCLWHIKTLHYMQNMFLGRHTLTLGEFTWGKDFTPLLYFNVLFQCLLLFSFFFPVEVWAYDFVWLLPMWEIQEIIESGLDLIKVLQVQRCNRFPCLLQMLWKGKERKFWGNVWKYIQNHTVGCWMFLQWFPQMVWIYMDMDSSTVADWSVLSCKKILATQNDLFPLKFIYKMAIKRFLEISGFQITCEINMYQIELCCIEYTWIVKW